MICFFFINFELVPLMRHRHPQGLTVALLQLSSSKVFFCSCCCWFLAITLWLGRRGTLLFLLLHFLLHYQFSASCAYHFQVVVFVLWRLQLQMQMEYKNNKKRKERKSPKKKKCLQSLQHTHTRAQ